MRWNPKGSASLAALAAVALVWACSPDSPTPVDPLEVPVAYNFTPVAGAAFTTYNPWVDGDFKEVCKNSIINCNIYGAKPDVWLNGGPTANGLRPDGEYFFAVLVPGGQPNPNDGGAKNLSDDFDPYTNRQFTITDGEVSAYGGTHDLDSGPFLDPDRKTCKSPRGCEADGEPPLIRLFPYADTWNPGGVYILAICTLENGYPVRPRDCKYDAFKVKEGKVTYEFMLSGIKFEDMDADGSAYVDGIDRLLEGWEITIQGTGFDGQPIDATVYTDADGAWDYSSPEYAFGPKDPVQDAELTVCETVQDGWYQASPDPACYDLTIAPAGAAVVPGLDFGNYQPAQVTGKKFYDRNTDGTKAPDEAWVVGFRFCLYAADGELVDDGDFLKDPEPACQRTGDDGSVTWENLKPGDYTVKEADEPYWKPTGVTEMGWTLLSGGSEAHEFGNVAICIGLTPGYWSNWRNHYTRVEFEGLLAGTIAQDVDTADQILNATGCDAEDSYDCMLRFVLANQLTLNLTQTSGVFNDGVELYGVCQLVDKDVDGNLQSWLEKALAVEPPNGEYDRDYVLTIKTVLDWFANMYFNPISPN